MYGYHEPAAAPTDKSDWRVIRRNLAEALGQERWKTPLPDDLRFSDEEVISALDLPKAFEIRARAE